MLLTDLLRRSADEVPDKPAAVFASERCTFRELERAANRLANALRARGISPKKRVALLQDNAIAALTSYWGVLKSGAESVDVPTLAGVQTIHTILEESRPDALVVNPRQATRLRDAGWPGCPPLLLGTEEVREITAGAPGRFLSLEEVLASTPDDPISPDVHASDVAMIIYTSGTTGRPKGVMLSHENLISNVDAFNSRIRLGREDSLLVVVPLYYIHGRIQLLTHASIGGTLFFSAGFQFPKVVLDELTAWAPTGISGVPYHFATLLAQTKLKTTPLPHLKNITITGGALSPAQLAELASAVPGARIHVNYGQTESSPRLTYLGPDEIEKKATSCGRPLPGVTIEILDAEGRPVAPGEVGEVVASGPGIMRGYVSGDERASGRIDEQGRLHTGDLGRLDAEGYLHLAGRSSEMIKSAGERIFPREIEEVIERLPGVRECAALGLPDPLLGEKIVALIVPDRDPPLLPQEVRTFCLKQLPFVRTPREIRFTAELPKTSSGKIRRAELRALFEQAAAKT